MTLFHARALAKHCEKLVLVVIYEFLFKTWNILLSLAVEQQQNKATSCSREVKINGELLLQSLENWVLSRCLGPSR